MAALPTRHAPPPASSASGGEQRSPTRRTQAAARARNRPQGGDAGRAPPADSGPPGGAESNGAPMGEHAGRNYTPAEDILNPEGEPDIRWTLEEESAYPRVIRIMINMSGRNVTTEMNAHIYHNSGSDSRRYALSDIAPKGQGHRWQ